MKLSRLLDRPYLNRTDLPSPKWSRRKPLIVGGIHIPPAAPYNPDDISYLLGLAHNYTMRPLIFEQKLIKNSEELFDTIFSNAEKIESSLLSQIHALIKISFMESRTPILSDKEFDHLSLPQKCQYLEMTEYLLDRNLNDLFQYQTFLAWETI